MVLASKQSLQIGGEDVNEIKPFFVQHHVLSRSFHSLVAKLKCHVDDFQNIWLFCSFFFLGFQYRCYC